MNMFNDPSMKEIIIEFCDESDKLFDELEKHLTNLEQNPRSSADLEKFGQIIDRIMEHQKLLNFVN
jgi:uncharacterized protein Yka (UPF0111/DUF47 family)